MNSEKTGYFARLLAAFLGRDVPPPVSGPTSSADERQLEFQATVSGLKMELRERDEQVRQLKNEYAALEAARQRATSEAAADQLERLFKRLAGTLGNLNVLTAMADAGREVETGDLIQLIKGLEKELGRAGLEPIGAVGEKTLFAVASHQRMSGGAVRDGVPVTVQIPGYRLGEKILSKALVSARADEPRQEQDNGPDRD
jgi:molecular chaperone GrpE (heat shock protein)